MRQTVTFRWLARSTRDINGPAHIVGEARRQTCFQLWLSAFERHCSPVAETESRLVASLVDTANVQQRSTTHHDLTDNRSRRPFASSVCGAREAQPNSFTGAAVRRHWQKCVRREHFAVDGGSTPLQPGVCTGETDAARQTDVVRTAECRKRLIYWMSSDRAQAGRLRRYRRGKLLSHVAEKDK